MQVNRKTVVERLGRGVGAGLITAAITLGVVGSLRAEQPAATSAEPAEAAEGVESSASGACSAIHKALSRLAQAERDQALALQLFARGGQMPIVETRLQRLQQACGDLREILRRVHAGRFADETSVAECLKLGYQSLFAAEAVASAVEQVLIKAREPLAGRG